jgi:DNA invertase Pin-like site-specific DNA recombinase
MTTAIAYLRVSSKEQGKSGLGIEAQRETVARFCERESVEILKEFIEIESGKGFDALELRPELAAAVKLAKKTGSLLVVAKVDRLSRSVAFISRLLEEKTVRFIVAELGLNADETTILMFATFAQREREMISQRTKAALGALKARGVTLGNPTTLEESATRGITQIKAKADYFASRIGPIIKSLRDAKNEDGKYLTSNQIAERLNELRIPTQRGGTWHTTSVSRILARIG